jgi:hypothetical protein
MKIRKAEREKNIQMAKAFTEVYHRDKYKTCIVELDYDEAGKIVINPLFHRVVTKQTYITSCLWLEWRNKLVNDNRKGFVQLPNKPNWLVLVRNFKRMQERKIKVLEYLNERKKRNPQPSITTSK